MPSPFRFMSLAVLITTSLLPNVANCMQRSTSELLWVDTKTKGQVFYVAYDQKTNELFFALQFTNKEGKEKTASIVARQLQSPDEKTCLMRIIEIKTSHIKENNHLKLTEAIKHYAQKKGFDKIYFERPEEKLFLGSARLLRASA